MSVRVSMTEQIILFGAGAAGQYALRHLRAQGIEPVAFADSHKFAESLLGLLVHYPEDARIRFPEAKWVACGISRPAAIELRQQIARMGVASIPLWKCLPVCHDPAPGEAFRAILGLSADAHSRSEIYGQKNFRLHPDYDIQLEPSPMEELYFPPFILPRDDEHFIDCGAADGDTVKAVMDRFPGWVTAIEPDKGNFAKLDYAYRDNERVTTVNAAIGDSSGEVSFVAAGDYSSHVNGVESRDAMHGTLDTVPVVRLDDIVVNPTYIKMDVEGFELEALWGARRVIRECSPVLAVCAYHTSDHLWQIPLLIHSLNPGYKLFFRRYAEGAFELVWYAIPPERVCHRRLS